MTAALVGPLTSRCAPSFDFAIESLRCAFDSAGSRDWLSKLGHTTCAGGTHEPQISHYCLQVIRQLQILGQTASLYHSLKTRIHFMLRPTNGWVMLGVVQVLQVVEKPLLYLTQFWPLDHPFS